jgi:hypothetical protein
MFAVFLTGKEKLRLLSTVLLIKKHLENPANPYRRELLEFKFKNKLITIEELEMVMKMLKLTDDKYMRDILDVMQNHPASPI